jgi:hypothetical protein
MHKKSYHEDEKERLTCRCEDNTGTKREHSEMGCKHVTYGVLTQTSSHISMS